MNKEAMRNAAYAEVVKDLEADLVLALQRGTEINVYSHGAVYIHLKDYDFNDESWERVYYERVRNSFVIRRTHDISALGVNKKFITTYSCPLSLTNLREIVEASIETFKRQLELMEKK